MARFRGGNLIATYALDPDNQDNPYRLSGFQISKDGGGHWGRRYGMLMQHEAVAFVPEKDDALLGIPSELMQLAAGDDRNFVGPAYLFEHGGDRFVMIPDGVRVLDWPWPVALTPGPQPRTNWTVGVSITGSVLRIGNRVLATAYGQKKGDHFDRTMLVASEDNGYTWRYFSTIANPDLSHASELGFEGANETSVIQLADGDLMAVFRTGNGEKWKLYRNYSHDGGRTWGVPGALAAYSVWPQMVRTANGAIVLATGRPGVDLWVSTDPRARTWQRLDLVAHHNRWAPDPSYRIGHFPIHLPYTSDAQMWESTAYTAMVEVAPNQILLIYDRDPERAPANGKDFSRLFVLPIEVERK